ncbi:BA14K family protein [Brevundimonas sp.]|jgi:hypothetical protein|uniref:BA14K family protein n=1 Tax=Brevundimonas sp. TaxID=1871086 RepID=UPI002E0E791A|nr:BA14K family protein [Brevundimonas sp.]
MKPLAAALVAAGLAAGAASAAQAQVIAGWNVSGQWDRGGDYRCDAYWDANRTDCDAAWRTPRGGHRYDHRGDHRRQYARQDHGYGHGYGRQDRWRGHAPTYGYGQAPAVAYPAAYGRPDLVYGGGGGQGYGYGHGARDPHRIAWCRASYRSYDPNSGYYRAYSGRLVWCG